MREELDSMSRSMSTVPLNHSRNRLQIRIDLKTAERQTIGVAPYENSCSVFYDFNPERGVFLVTPAQRVSLLFLSFISFNVYSINLTCTYL